MGKWLIIIGGILVAIGLLLHFFPGVLGWVGRMPGDIHIRREKSEIFIPITTMIVISILLTILANLFKR